MKLLLLPISDRKPDFRRCPKSLFYRELMGSKEEPHYIRREPKSFIPPCDVTTFLSKYTYHLNIAGSLCMLSASSHSASVQPKWRYTVCASSDELGSCTASAPHGTVPVHKYGEAIRSQSPAREMPRLRENCAAGDTLPQVPLAFIQHGKANKTIRFHRHHTAPVRRPDENLLLLLLKPRRIPVLDL